MGVVIEGGMGGSIVVPVLVTGQAKQIEWEGKWLPLHAVGEDECLVGSLNAEDARKAEAVFPGKRLIWVSLDAADLLPGPSAAWESLDAVVLDCGDFSRISDFERSTLLAGGVTFVAVGERAPDSRWPWKKSGAGWVLCCRVAGPQCGVINAGVYSPTFAWAGGWPARVRRQVVGVGVLILLIFFGLMLRDFRGVYFVAIGVCVFAAVGIVCWREALGSVVRGGGDIFVGRDGMLQRDQYVYERAREDSNQIVPWAGSTHPLFGSRQGMIESGMRLNVSAGGKLSFGYHAFAGHTMAFLRRSVEPGALQALASTDASPMRELVKDQYLDGGNRIGGETSQSGERWGGVVIEGK